MQFCEVMETRSLVVGLISLAAWIFYMAMAQTANAQSIQTIDLKASPGLLQPQEFYIKQVLDGRKDKSTLGYVMDVSGTSSKKQPLGLEGGTVNAIEKFIHRSLDKKSTLRPVIFTIKELRIAEVVQPDGVVSGNVSISVIFETEKEIGRVKLVEYRGGTKYSRSSSRNLDPGPVISKNIGNALEYFNRWINMEAPHNEKLAQGLELSISDVRARADKDTLFYNSRKSLSWSDFRSQPDMKSRFAAEVFPFFSFEESSKIENSIVHLDLKLKVYLVKNFSWVKAYARNSNTLLEFLCFASGL